MTVIRTALAALALASAVLVAPAAAQATPRGAVEIQAAADYATTRTAVPRRGDWFFCTREYVKRDPRCRPAPRRV